jgi:hypothetical protein
VEGRGKGGCAALDVWAERVMPLRLPFLGTDGCVQVPDKGPAKVCFRDYKAFLLKRGKDVEAWLHRLPSLVVSDLVARNMATEAELGGVEAELQTLLQRGRVGGGAESRERSRSRSRSRSRDRDNEADRLGLTHDVLSECDAFIMEATAADEPRYARRRRAPVQPLSPSKYWSEFELRRTGHRHERTLEVSYAESRQNEAELTAALDRERAARNRLEERQNTLKRVARQLQVLA